MQPKKLLQRLNAGHVENVRFRDFQRLLEACGFELDRVTGSHHVYINVECGLMLNLQQVRGVAKAYQIRQFLRLLQRYDLDVKERR